MTPGTPTAGELRADLERAYDGDPWHGSSLAALLDGLDAAEAHGHPIAGAHSPWEVVAHVAAWTREVARRLRGGTPATPEAGDWPAPPAASTPAAWAAARAELAAAHADVLAALDECPPDRLDAPVGNVRDPALGSGLTHAGMVRGLAQHHAYHGGQIAMLRRAAAVRPPAA
jgi:uncharacterized damage-inducible protein DinB